MITLHDFIKKYVAKNTLIRLWKPQFDSNIYTRLILLTQKPVMEWEILNIDEFANILMNYVLLK